MDFIQIFVQITMLVIVLSQLFIIVYTAYVVDGARPFPSFIHLLLVTGFIYFVSQLSGVTSALYWWYAGLATPCIIHMYASRALDAVVIYIPRVMGVLITTLSVMIAYESSIRSIELLSVPPNIPLASAVGGALGSGLVLFVLGLSILMKPRRARA